MHRSTPAKLYSFAPCNEFTHGEGLGHIMSAGAQADNFIGLIITCSKHKDGTGRVVVMCLAFRVSSTGSMISIIMRSVYRPQPEAVAAIAGNTVFHLRGQVPPDSSCEGRPISTTRMEYCPVRFDLSVVVLIITFDGQRQYSILQPAPSHPAYSCSIAVLPLSDILKVFNSGFRITTPYSGDRQIG